VFFEFSLTGINTWLKPLAKAHGAAYAAKRVGWLLKDQMGATLKPHIFRTYLLGLQGLSTDFLSSMRILSMSAEEDEAPLCYKKVLSAPISLENEFVALSLAASVISSQLSVYSTSRTDDLAQLKHPMAANKRMALLFRQGRKHVLESALSAAAAGASCLASSTGVEWSAPRAVAPALPFPDASCTALLAKLQKELGVGCKFDEEEEDDKDDQSLSYSPNLSTKASAVEGLVEALKHYDIPSYGEGKAFAGQQGLNDLYKWAPSEDTTARILRLYAVAETGVALAAYHRGSVDDVVATCSITDEQKRASMSEEEKRLCMHWLQSVGKINDDGK